MSNNDAKNVARNEINLREANKKKPNIILAIIMNNVAIVFLYRTLCKWEFLGKHSIPAGLYIIHTALFLFHYNDDTFCYAVNYNVVCFSSTFDTILLILFSLFFRGNCCRHLSSAIQIIARQWPILLAFFINRRQQQQQNPKYPTWLKILPWTTLPMLSLLSSLPMTRTTTKQTGHTVLSLRTFYPLSLDKKDSQAQLLLYLPSIL